MVINKVICRVTVVLIMGRALTRLLMSNPGPGPPSRTGGTTLCRGAGIGSSV